MHFPWRDCRVGVGVRFIEGSNVGVCDGGSLERRLMSQSGTLDGHSVPSITQH